MAQTPDNPRASEPLVAAERPRWLTVGELVRRIQGALEAGLGPVWVVGEISNLRAAPSGHCYFTLKDDQAQLTAVLFRNAAARLRFRPSDGLEVVAGGRIRLYEARGALQLYVDSLEPHGLGALRRQLERLRDQLAAEGLLDAQRKRPLPFLPRTIGVVTALGGAAIHDILSVLRDRFAERRVIVRPVRVQGAGAEREIAQGIDELSALAEVEVLIVGRGGGSIEDLWAFNDEGVARAIAGCRVPVVSAVGHEIDVTIADLVADARAPTPSAAAALVVPRKLDLEIGVEERRRALAAALKRHLESRRRALAGLRLRLRDPRRGAVLARARGRELAARLRRGFGRALLEARDSLRLLEDRLVLGSPARRLAALRAGLGEAEPRLAGALRQRSLLARARLRTAAATLSSLSPLAVLERGYAVAWKVGDDRPLRAADAVRVGDALRVRLARGALRARVESREPERDD
ncbi:MAG: exodeoxyribonuclease VII large subunit [Deltaproteobacteria bacterium]|nr:exodeoxyribonuclease VII large subunit [Deltaproteobacteria bacterium]